MVYDFCIIGGGIVGLATALKLSEAHPGAGILVIEKESAVARHQTGHNSGVIHSGIYYTPGSFKAELCRRGAAATVDFCREHTLPFEVCGKLLVATNEAERQRMLKLFERASVNKVDAELIDAAELKRREPNITGVGAIYVPSTGITDYKQICAAMASEIVKRGNEIALGAEVVAIEETADQVSISSPARSWQARHVIVCGGLQSDRLARIAGLKVDYQVVPFRGEYYRLPPGKNRIVESLIYPIPNPDLPFLGIHLTRMIDGCVTVGPNAVLGWSREGYPKFSVSPRDVAEFVRFPGFWKVIRSNMRAGVLELANSMSKRRYLAECRKYCPSLSMTDLEPNDAGIRAQAVLADGTLVHDFLFHETDRMLHVCNAPSPAATSALPIGEMIAEKVDAKMRPVFHAVSA
jgi:(S)-2-hydroxyglutarate dehydrogenase